MTHPPGMTLIDYVRELTTPHIHREHYTTREHGTWWGRNHITLSPPLIDQLRYAEPSTSGESRGSGGYGSRPTARIEAMDCLIRIDRDASAWVRNLGEDDPGDTAACVRKLGSLLPSTHDVTRRAAARDLRSWWTQARIQSGWDSAAWRPDNTCPLCGTRGGLRVKLADSSALCVECRETWTPDTVAFLAGHIRDENHDTADTG